MELRRGARRARPGAAPPRPRRRSKRRAQPLVVPRLRVRGGPQAQERVSAHERAVSIAGAASVPPPTSPSAACRRAPRRTPSRPATRGGARTPRTRRTASPASPRALRARRGPRARASAARRSADALVRRQVPDSRQTPREARAPSRARTGRARVGDVVQPDEKFGVRLDVRRVADTLFQTQLEDVARGLVVSVVAPLQLRRARIHLGALAEPGRLARAHERLARRRRTLHAPAAPHVLHVRRGDPVRRARARKRRRVSLGRVLLFYFL